MAVHIVAIYSPADFGITGPSGYFTTPSSLTTTASPDHDFITINDPDSEGGFFNDGTPENPQATPTQTFTGTVEGTTYTDAPISMENAFAVYDTAAMLGDPIGYIYMVYDGNGLNFGDLYGYISTFVLDPNTTYYLDHMSGVTSFPYDGVICFASGTLIETKFGLVPVELIQIGDLVETLDHGFSPVRWVGKRHLSAAELAFSPSLRPVLFERGSLGVNQPSRPLMVSPQHRILLQGALPELLYGEREVLAPAKSLVNNCEIRPISNGRGVTYVHLMFDRHEIIRSNGCWSESFHPGVQALSSLDRDAREELLRIFPELEAMDTTPELCRPVVSRREASALQLA